MRKQKPSYNLETAKRLIKNEETRVISYNAQQGADSIGYSIPELVDLFATLESKDLIKSETDHHDHTIWQDYYSKFDGNIHIFIKFKISKDTIIILTSFKEDTNRTPRRG